MNALPSLRRWHAELPRYRCDARARSGGAADASGGEVPQCGERGRESSGGRGAGEAASGAVRLRSAVSRVAWTGFQRAS